MQVRTFMPDPPECIIVELSAPSPDNVLFPDVLSHTVRDYTAPLSNTNAKSSAADNQEDEDADVSCDTNVWEPRRCFLWDNYIFELLLSDPAAGVQVDETRPVGFINLSDALVEHLHPPSPNISRSSSGMFRSLSSASIGIQQCSSGVSLDDDWSGDQVAPVVSVRYYASAAPTAQRRVVVLRCSTRKETLKLMQLLLIASRVSWGCLTLILISYSHTNLTRLSLC